jgi:hypothetical protein
MSSDKIDPGTLAKETGVDVEDVEAVLTALCPNWLFSQYVAWRSFDAQPKPKRSEPADFGGGESTGAEEL